MGGNVEDVWFLADEFGFEIAAGKVSIEPSGA